MAISTTYFTFLYLSEHRGPRIMPREHICYRFEFQLGICMVEIENNRISFATINTAFGR
ncbi:MAG: hypothetical protein G01um101456_537 [Parcubacteria group bacterium Gr01-1014_56]|nr:MAG: hypothetical protein G01um101456_537 [Parcubacteria group bacterium Gr01-1014_56]